MSGHLIVTGTDTGVGKTVISAALVHALGAAYWKPVQAGLDEETDREAVTRLARLRDDRVFPEAYRLKTPASPHFAAAEEGVLIDPDRLTPPQSDRLLVIEGAGGVLVPLAEPLLYADMFAQWRAPVVLVARTSLGTINHSLLSIEALRSRNIPIAGIAFVGDAVPDSERTICAIGQVRRLGRLPHLSALDYETLHMAFAEGFDLEALDL
ncbi:dethiobiotin synthase [Stakelama tenebrarum]|uniref:ATP-dependent dethiobiotin synthetase BioD n=1 Tax=Stakelama tenebrarum TaxID=2711215 RepID=A0A6G6Y709_9SPHN|nr:dethiobiotin synthase [Sphingosinithalassobacter tenebrarum]QIG80700.1 ATP-dependent dethiobiotin synthetase BioD [Sphingosinithalassobacter tenebrarum]